MHLTLLLFLIAAIVAPSYSRNLLIINGPHDDWAERDTDPFRHWLAQQEDGRFASLGDGVQPITMEAVLHEYQNLQEDNDVPLVLLNAVGGIFNDQPFTLDFGNDTLIPNGEFLDELANFNVPCTVVYAMSNSRWALQFVNQLHVGSTIVTLDEGIREWFSDPQVFPSSISAFGLLESYLLNQFNSWVTPRAAMHLPHGIETREVNYALESHFGSAVSQDGFARIKQLLPSGSSQLTIYKAAKNIANGVRGISSPREFVITLALAMQDVNPLIL